MEKVTGDDLASLVTNAVEKCEKKPIENLLIHGIFDIKEIDSGLIDTFNEDAELWQQDTIPNELIINHGSFIVNQYGDGRLHVGQELKRKNDSNRACISLIDMKEIINSGDKAIPSFMILQFGFSPENPKRILTSAYFRALEVSCFLPINLAEICMNIRYLKNNFFRKINQFELNIFTFRAQVIPSFHCLRKSHIDILNPMDIFKIVYDQDIRELIKLLENKMKYAESIINIEGLMNLSMAIEKSDNSEYKAFLPKIHEIINDMKMLKEERKERSTFVDLKPFQDRIHVGMKELIVLIEGGI